MEEKHDNPGAKKSETVILFLTRYFNEDHLAAKAYPVDSNTIDYFFLNNFSKGIQAKDNLGLDYSDIKKFWDTFKAKHKDNSEKALCANFDGKLRQLKIQRSDDTNSGYNVFFYHHWFDKQVTVKDSPQVVKDFIKVIISQINANLGIKKINNLKLVLHYGDFLEYEDNLQIKSHEIVNMLQKDASSVTIYRYHHKFGYPVYDHVLKCPELIQNIIDSNIANVEEYILERFDYAAVNKKFKNYLNF